MSQSREKERKDIRKIFMAEKSKRTKSYEKFGWKASSDLNVYLPIKMHRNDTLRTEKFGTCIFNWLEESYSVFLDSLINYSAWI